MTGVHHGVVGDDLWRDAGDPACWLGVICPQCGEVREDRSLERCVRCGYDFDAGAPGSDDEAARR
jgi:hypothetical protein